MSEIDSKLCKICLNSGTGTGLSTNPPLNMFFSHILGIQEPPLTLWLCIWCKAVLRKTMQLMQLAKESQRILSDAKLINTANKYNKNNEIKNFHTLTHHHNDHYDIPPDKEKHKLKTKSKSAKKTTEIHFVDLEDNKDTETRVKDEMKNDIGIDAVKLEAVDVDVAIDDDIDSHDNFSDNHDEVEDKTGRPKRQVNPKLYAKCEENNFTLRVLTYEEQIDEMEEKKRNVKYLNRKFKCEFCGIGFVTKEVYEEHMKRHDESYSPHLCPVCRLRFGTAAVLSQHLLAHARRFTCRLCAGVLARYSDCESHRLKCGRAMPGVCKHCRKIFSNQNSLEQHIRGVHYKKEKKFVCSFCNQRFQSKQRLAIHTRTHTGAKPYTCDVCHRSFAANSNLRNHLAAHAQARPHYCVECDKSYKTRKGLRRHLQEGATHKGRKHSCQYCLRNFTNEKLLIAHIAASHTKETDSCDPSYKTISTCGNLDKQKGIPESPNIIT